MKARKKILIIDDHPVFREGIKTIIGRCHGFRVTAEAGGSREGLGMALQVKPDIILLDISLPDGNGIDLIGEIRTVLPQVVILMVSVHSDTAFIADSFRAGATGYYVKGSLSDILVEALEVVSRGGYFFEHALSPEAAEGLKDLAPEGAGDDRSRYASLSSRQKEVLKLLVQGLSYEKIAFELAISPRTVKNHRAQIVGRLGVKNRAELIRFAARLGLGDTHH